MGPTMCLREVYCALAWKSESNQERRQGTRREGNTQFRRSWKYAVRIHRWRHTSQRYFDGTSFLICLTKKSNSTFVAKWNSIFLAVFITFSVTDYFKWRRPMTLVLVWNIHRDDWAVRVCWPRTLNPAEYLEIKQERSVQMIFKPTDDGRDWLSCACDAQQYVTSTEIVIWVILLVCCCVL